MKNGAPIHIDIPSPSDGPVKSLAALAVERLDALLVCQGDAAKVGVLVAAAHGAAKRARWSNEQLQRFTADLWESLGSLES